MTTLISGSLAYDYIMSFPGYFEDHILPDKIHVINVSFQVDSLDRHRGGVAGNIAYNLGLLGEPCRVVAPVGNDFADYGTELENLGVDTSGIWIVDDLLTACAFITTDMADNQITGFFPGAMSQANEIGLDGHLKDVSLAVIAPTDPAGMDRHVRELQDAAVPYVYDPGQQIIVSPPEALRRGVLGAQILIGNDYELAMIEEKTGMSREEITEAVPCVAITLGELGSTIHIDGEWVNIPAVMADSVVDPTGAGDAFRSGFICGYNRGLEVSAAGRLGSLAAVYAVESLGTQAHTYTLDEVVARARDTFPDYAETISDALEATLMLGNG